MSSLSDLLEFSLPDEFEAAIPQEIRDRVKAMTNEEVMHRFDDLWSRSLREFGARFTLEDRQEYFLLKQRYVKISRPR
jgi:hypothetical protein